MKMIARNQYKYLLIFPFFLSYWAIAQEPNAVLEPNSSPMFKQEEIEQIVAPIALYPDNLLSQILMASTYPIEVIEAERWIKENNDVKGDALATALKQKNWDPSVKSLVNFPQVLSMMSEKLDWMQKLGDAFLSQQEDVMKAVQKLRSKASTEGNLKSTEEQVVKTEQQNIIIESANPQEIYIPTYDPGVVYGSWPYPAYPPYNYYPPGYSAGSNLLSFGVGFGLGAAWGYAWGNCDWNGKDIDIDYDRNFELNRNIDREKYKQQARDRSQRGQGEQGKWQHDPSHRRGVSYSDQKVSQRFNRGSNPSDVRSREAFRGRSQQTIGGTSDRISRSQGQRGQLSDRATSRTSSRSVSDRGGAFKDINSGSSVRSSSSRGRSSRQSMSQPSGGGRSRGGGGGGGGGRGGRR
ncbi:MAG: DUF3300 domain-containing protein [Phycisphaerales bacterium]